MAVQGFIQGTVSFLYYLWRGQLGLPFTYWVVGMFGNFSVFLLPLLILDSLGEEMNTAHIIHLLVSAAYFVFSTVCVVRAAGNNKRPRTWPF